jgi:hypothetical protein
MWLVEFDAEKHRRLNSSEEEERCRGGLPQSFNDFHPGLKFLKPVLTNSHFATASGANRIVHAESSHGVKVSPRNGPKTLVYKLGQFTRSADKLGFVICQRHTQVNELCMHKLGRGHQPTCGLGIVVA